MKLMKKFIFVNILCVATIFQLAAADNASSDKEKIQLPDVTTTVSGDSLTAGKNAIPDFTVTLPEADKTTAPLPQLPAAKSEAVVEEPEADLTTNSDKAIYAEGLIGGGFPGFFSGDFSIYKSSGSNPFILRFFHESANGYGTHSAADGFFDSKTELSGTKQTTFSNAVLKLGASYATASNGLESLSNCFFDTTRQTVSTGDSIEWSLPYGFGILLGMQSNWYSRYAGMIAGSTTTYTAQEADASLFYMEPKATFAWNYTQKETTAHIDFSAAYSIESMLSDVDYDETAILQEQDTTMINRGQFGLTANWSNAFVTVDGNTGIVVGALSQKDGIPTYLAAPFSLGLTTHLNTKDTGKQIIISAKGGLDSYLPQYAELEKTYAWTAQKYLPSETSDWFASAKTEIPLGSSFSFSASGDFKKTAFGNGVWEPVYTETTSTGLYQFAQIDRTLFDSDIGFSFLWKLMTLSADWKAYWLYVPVTEDAYSLGATCSIQAADGFWGTNVSLREGLGENVDAVPVLNVGGFLRMTDTLRLALEVNDTIKLVTGTDRAYAGSKYLSRAGSATLLVKFFF